MFRLGSVATVAAVVAAAGSAWAATPPQGTLAPDANGQGAIIWAATVNPGDTTGGSTDDCFDKDKKPRNTSVSGCDLFKPDANVPDRFYNGLIGGFQFDITDSGASAVNL